MRRMAWALGLAGSCWGGAVASARPPHPEPRVIVNVLSVEGPHRREAVEHSARLAWGKIVHCYKAIDRHAKGKLEFDLALSRAGRVERARLVASTLEDPRWGACLSEAYRGLSMPKADADSLAHTEIRLAPGDPD